MTRFIKAEFLSDDFIISNYFKSKNIDMLVCYKEICNYKNCVKLYETSETEDALHNQKGGNMLNYNILRKKNKI